MKPAALMVFTVSYNGIRIRVRVLPTVRDVHREYTNSPLVTHQRIGKDKVVNGFTAPTDSPSAKHTATVVLAASGRLEEDIPHEVAHVVIHKRICVHRDDDEAAATAIGILSARISRKIVRAGIAT